MSAEPAASQPPEQPPVWAPPAGPPQPPFEPDMPELASTRLPLTDVAWSVGESVWLVLFTVVLVIAAGVAGGLISAAAPSESVSSLLLGVLLGGVYLAVIAVVAGISRARNVPLSRAVGMRRLPLGVLVGGSVAVALLGRLVAGVWGAVLQALDIRLPGMDLDPTKLFPPGPMGIVAMVLVAVLLAPIAEEIVFRGVLLSALQRRYGNAVAIGVSSLAFGLIHGSPAAIPPIVLFAMALGWLFVRYRSLTVCIAAHALFNGIALGLLYALKATGVV